jgi:anhydro-N-acetylmuramic acid kinase
VIVVGLMSGTSMDGLDAAVADFALADDVITMRLLGGFETPWPAELRARLLAVLPPGRVELAEVCELDAAVGLFSAEAVAKALAVFAGGRGDLVSSHGQTVFHWVEQGTARGTLQLGQPAWIAEATGLPVVSDLRSRDIAAGGQGAPLASTLDALWLADRDGAGSRRAALNLGGIANITVVGAPGDPVVAFDTGPANCLLDVFVQRMTGGSMASDLDGRIARSGTVREDLLARLLDEPYYRQPAPKSTGRELFHLDYLDRRTAGLPPVADVDAVATLTELTAVTVADACRPLGLTEVVASGGGVRNPALLAALRARLGSVPLVTSDERGLPAGFKEAYLFALLGFLSWHQIPGVVAGATGCAEPRILGRISPGNGPLRLPEPGRVPRSLSIVG